MVGYHYFPFNFEMLKLTVLAAVVGLQYYHIAKIVLAVSSCPSPVLAYENLKHSRNIEVCFAPELYIYSDSCYIRPENHPEPSLNRSRSGKVKHKGRKHIIYCQT